MSQEPTQVQDAKCLDEARCCLQLGYFEGALQRALRIQHHPELGRSARATAWITRVYLGEKHWKDALNTKSDMEELKSLGGGQGLAEYACLLKELSAKADAEGIQQILQVTDAQHGVFVSWHPSAILRLAEFALEILRDRRSAVVLTNIVLGFRGIFVSLTDVDRLARLLIKLEAPICLWADWCTVLIQHVRFATNRADILREFLQAPAHGVRWSIAQDAAGEGVVRSVLAVAPREVREILRSLVPHFDAVGLAEIIRDHLISPGEPGKRSAESLWSEPRLLRYRHFWYDMISEAEQNLIRNGDWALFGLPTDDFSMGLAQWWRALESALKRSVVDVLSSTFAQQPQLAMWDRENLNANRKKEEAIFLDKLTAPNRAAKLTLYDILIVLKKCESTNEGGVVGSRLRLEAAQILKRHSAQIGTLTKGTWLNPAHLTEENINWFRNRSAHDASVSLIDAAIGRVLSKRIFDGFFAPVLEKWGLKPMLL